MYVKVHQVGSYWALWTTYPLKLTSYSLIHPQNPTDKQIEARTSDGRRRITPIFIPPPNVENGAPEQSATSQRFGMVEFGSSSTQEKSRIAVEKRNDIVKPNISPGKTRENEHPTSDDQNNMTKQDTPTTITSTASSVRNEEPKVNIIQVNPKIPWNYHEILKCLTFTKRPFIRFLLFRLRRNHLLPQLQPHRSPKNQK